MLSILFRKKHSTASVSSLTCPGVIQWEKALKSTTRPMKCVAQKARVIVGFRAMTSALSLLAHFYWQTRILLYFDFGRFWAFAKLPGACNGRFEFAWDRCLCSDTRQHSARAIKLQIVMHYLEFGGSGLRLLMAPKHRYLRFWEKTPALFHVCIFTKCK